ncbi:MAG: radical SAM protein [Cyanobacteria bacterium REEB65]|nr:radical SAM protein [Cyanobacteria bacterium REEB65]
MLTAPIGDRPSPAAMRAGQLPEAARPLVLMLALTNGCNLSCRHCYREEGQAFADELTPAEIAKLLEDFAALCAELGRPGGVVFSGGEPILHPFLGLATRIARSLGLFTRINTNATLATPAVAKELAAWGLQVAQVSLDGPSAAVHESVRGDGTWEFTRRGIANLQEAGISVELKVTLIRGRNDTDPGAYLRVAAQWRVAVVSFARLVPLGSGRELSRYDAASYRSVLERLAAARVEGVVAEVRDATFDRSYRLGMPQRFRSEEGYSVLAIDADGTCMASRRMPIKLGNIRTTRLADLWRHPWLEQIRGRPPGGKCRRCAMVDWCRGGSRAAAWAVAGDLMAPDPACWLEE